MVGWRRVWPRAQTVGASALAQRRECAHARRAWRTAVQRTVVESSVVGVRAKTPIVSLTSASPSSVRRRARDVTPALFQLPPASLLLLSSLSPYASQLGSVHSGSLLNSSSTRLCPLKTDSPLSDPRANSHLQPSILPDLPPSKTFPTPSELLSELTQRDASAPKEEIKKTRKRKSQPDMNNANDGYTPTDP